MLHRPSKSRLSNKEDLLSFLLQLLLARFDDAHNSLIAVLASHKRWCKLHLWYDHEFLLLNKLLDLAWGLRAFLNVDYVD